MSAHYAVDFFMPVFKLFARSSQSIALIVIFCNVATVEAVIDLLFSADDLTLCILCDEGTHHLAKVKMKPWIY